MVGHRPLDQDEIQSMMESGGLKPETLRKRQKVVEAFGLSNSIFLAVDPLVRSKNQSKRVQRFQGLS